MPASPLPPFSVQCCRNVGNLLILSMAACVHSADRADTVATAPPVVTILATEYVFEAVDSIPSGPTTFRLVSRGKQEHFVQLVRITPPHTLAEFKQALADTGQTPWATSVGGVGTIEPGGTALTSIDLGPGLYALVCDMEDPKGVPHYAEGMLRLLTVTADRRSATMPAADVSLNLAEYAFVFPDSLVAGEHRIGVSNIGSKSHMALLWRLQPGKQASDVVRWMHDSSDTGPAPVTLVGGTPDLEPGHAVQIVARLEAGRYHFPEATAAGIELSAAQFAMILDGIDLSRVRRFKRFSPADAQSRAT